MIVNTSSIHVPRSSPIEIYSENFISSFRNSDILKRIKEAVKFFFAKIRDFFYRTEEQSVQPNLKTIAVISCLCLITLLTVSIFWLKDKPIIRRRSSSNPLQKSSGNSSKSQSLE